MIVQSDEKYTVYSFSPTLDNIIGNFVTSSMICTLDDHLAGKLIIDYAFTKSYIPPKVKKKA